VQVWHSSFSSIRKEEVMLTYLQIGHIHQTHRRLLHSELAPVCTQCGMPLIMLHMVEYPHYDEDHHTFYHHSMLWSILGDDCYAVSNMLAFLNGVMLARSI
jgi:hypothetical protein